MSAIETEGLTRRFEDLVAVDDLDLTVEEGEVFGFLGPNGAGKSTTINMLLGFLNPSDGVATVLGMDAASDSRAVRQRVGLLPEGFGLYENLTGREHVVSAIQTKNADDDPDELIDRVGLDAEAARRAAGGYSKGMGQRLALAIALVGSPDLLILDEPSSGLDPKGVKLLREIVREEQARGATVFFSSHVLGQVEQVCDRVGIMNDGRMTAVDTIDNLRERIDAESVVEATVDSVPDTSNVAAVSGVREVTTAGDTVRVACTRREAKMPVLRRLDDATTVTDVTIEDASLEALFEQYTGSTERDAPPARETPVAVPGGDDA
ncbi:ABC transporter ATP-binding protein [Halobacterium zhouii]|uniref:ABC transporter ATP-binding protein n=1 Tax=Halobacterium zhouii TaxID=2902624 RepID=UPI001E2EB03D|nr:ABC transporter ATP-binding protein [Halobacterium zhouii]